MRNSLLMLGMLALFSEAAWAETPTKLEGVVNLNTASPEELGLIPGVGPARVRNILAYRRAHPFRTVDELARIKGIGRKTVRKWRMHMAVGGPSTAQRVVRPEHPTVPPEQLATLAKPAPVVKPVVPKPALRPGLRPLPPPRPALRRGEPARALAVRAPGVSCLPPR
jgi:competence protein ComEA